MFRVRLVAIVFLALMLSGSAVRLTAADKHAFASGWRTSDIRVDGIDEEWRPILEPVKGQRLSMAFLNDDEALYFCLVTTDGKTIRQIGTMGLTLWLDPPGSAKKVFGVRFRPSQGQRVEVLGPGRKDVRQVDNGTSGIEARMDGRPDMLVYEARIPLRKTELSLFAPDVAAGAAMRVELETPEWRGPLPAAGMGGRTRISVGVGGPNGGIVYPGPDTTLLKPLNVAGSLQLAASPR